MANFGAWKVFNTATIDAGATETYPTGDGIPLRMVEGYFSAQVQATVGSTAAATTGTFDYKYVVSLDGSNYVCPTGGGVIATGHTPTKGPGSDGKAYWSFVPELAERIKIVVINQATDKMVTTVHLGVK